MNDLQVKTSTGGQCRLTGTDITEFKQKLRGPLLGEGDDSYDEVRQLWNGMHDKRPALIARCSGVADVVEAVNFARTHHLLVAVRGGGHNVAGSGSCDGGIMIDLSLMKGIHVDPQAKTARVQGGATWGDVDRETQLWGLATPGGAVSTTGVGGLTLGGGLGWLRRKHGLSIDNLLSVEIVTADGQVRTASQAENADLFWGIRGGGGNFGIVTSFEFRLYPVGPTVMLCAPWYPAENAKEVLIAWQKFMEHAPEELSSNAIFWSVPAAPGFPEAVQGKRALIIGAVYSGPVDEGARVVQPLRELGTLLLDLSGPLPWTVVQSAFDPFFPKGTRQYYFKSRYLKELSNETIDALIPPAINPPTPSTAVALWHNGGAMSRVGVDETAFMGRQASFLLSVDCTWDDPKQTDEVLAYARDYLAEMEPYSPGGLYVNFAGLGEEGEKLVKAAYGANYERLVALKNQYDPTNLFHLNQNIRPTVRVEQGL